VATIMHILSEHSRFGSCRLGHRCRPAVARHGSQPLGYHLVWSAKARIEQFADRETFRPIGRTIHAVDFLQFVDELPYATRLQLAREKSGLSEAAIIGRCRIRQIDTVLALLDFHFMGSVVGEQITRAFEYALRHRLPVVTVVNSGGARMQEGTMSLMQMPKTAAGLFYCSVLASPTTGGVWASFANLGARSLATQAFIAATLSQISRHGPGAAQEPEGDRGPAG
jgi:acyl-CoA carboxylase subunit beta